MKTFWGSWKGIFFPVASIIITICPLLLLNGLTGIPFKILASRSVVWVIFMLTLLLGNALVRMSKFRIPTAVLSTILFSGYAILQILEVYNLAAVGETFGMNFYTTMNDTKLIKDMAPGQIKEISSCASYLLIIIISFIAALITIPELRGKKRVVSAVAWGFLLLALGALLAFAPNPPVNFIKMFELGKVSPYTGDIPLEELKKYGINPCATTKETLKIYSKGSQKNLVLIILESMEKNFLDEELFPGLTPNLNRFRKMPGTIFFDNITDSGGYTAGAVFQIMYGMPLTPIVSPANAITNTHNISLMKNFVSLPFIFSKAGYRWTHIEPVPAFIELFKTENMSTDYKTEFKLQQSGSLAVEDNRDYKTFACAWTKFSSEAKKRTPFALSVVTIDGHGPNGFVSKQTTVPYPNKEKFPSTYNAFQQLDANYNTDLLIGEFVDNILNSPVGKNTIVAITNDHLLMGSAGGFIQKKPRKSMLMILNTDRNGLINIPGCTLDVAPTLIDIFNLKSNYIFPCGTSLLQKNINTSVKQRISSKSRSGLSVISQYILSKNNITTTSDSTISITKNSNSIFLNCFGQQMPFRYSSAIMKIYVDKNNVIASANYLSGYPPPIPIIRGALNGKSKEIFLFHGTDDKKNMILDRLGISAKNVEYALVYKHSNGNMKACFAERMEDLTLDVSDIINTHETGIVKYSFSRKKRKFLNPDDFTAESKVDYKIIADNHFTATGSNIKLFSKIHFPISEKFPVEYSATIKNNGKKNIGLYHGVRMFDKNGRWLEACYFPANRNISCATVVENKNDSNEIIVSGDLTGWKKGQIIAFNAQKDLYDIPNFDSNRVIKIAELAKLPDGNTRITITQKLKKALLPGTLLRVHGGRWSNVYKGHASIAPGKTIKIAGRLSIDPKLFHYPSGIKSPLPAACEKVQLILLTFGKDYTIEITDFKFRDRYFSADPIKK